METMLFERNDKIIDLCLAKICSEKIAHDLIDRYKNVFEIIQSDQFSDCNQSKILEDHKQYYFSNIISALLSNPLILREWNYRKTKFLDRIWNWIIKYGHKKHYDALFENVGHPVDAVLKALEFKYDEEVNENFYYFLKAVYSSKYLSTQSKNKYLKYNEIREKYWKIFHNIDPIKATNLEWSIIRAMTENYNNVPNFLFEETIYKNVSNLKYLSNDAKCQAIIDIVEKYNPNKYNQDDENYFLANQIITLIISSFIESEFIKKEFLFKYFSNHHLLAVRVAFYRSYHFNDNDIKYCINAFENDNENFIRAALDNWSFYDFSNSKYLFLWFKTLDKGWHDATPFEAYLESWQSTWNKRFLENCDTSELKIQKMISELSNQNDHIYDELEIFISSIDEAGGENV